MDKTPLSCGELFKRINDILEKNANKDLNKEDITLTQFKMLILLSHTPEGSATLKELERHFGVAQSTIAGIALRLERKGLISGHIDKEDKRIKHVAITDAGREICLTAKAKMAENEAQLLSPLTIEERKQLNLLLNRIYYSIK